MNPPKTCGEISPTTSSVFSVTVAVLLDSDMGLSSCGAADGLLVLAWQKRGLPIGIGPPARLLGVDPHVFVRRRQRFADALLELLRRKMIFRKILLVPRLIPPIVIHPQAEALRRVPEV